MNELLSKLQHIYATAVHTNDVSTKIVVRSLIIVLLTKLERVNQ